MEYYAKSKERGISKEKKENVEALLQEILQDPSYGLEEWEIRIFENEIKKLYTENVEKQKTLKEHEMDIVSCAEMFFKQYGKYFTEKEKILIIEACRIHDWGKANLLFQAIVNKEVATQLSIQDKKTKQIPHGFLSAFSISVDEFLQIADCFRKEDFDTFLTAVYYHHAREDEWKSKELGEYAEQYYRKYLEEYLGREKVLIRSSYHSKLLFRNSDNYRNKPIAWEKWLLYSTIKGMLNKFDYTVSAGYENAEINSDLEKRKLIKNIEEIFKNYDLRPVQTYMKENTEENLVVIAPTGSGKTEAALLWLNGEKGFYTLPLKVSSNAIYERIKVRYLYDDVALLHSDSMQVYLKESEDTYKKYERARLLANPLTICTVDQLFKFVYKALGTEIFPATLKYSKIVLDEIQSYSPQVIAAIIYGLKQVTAMGGKFAIITATFPPVLEDFMKQYGLLKGEDYQFQDFSDSSDWLRHKVDIRDGEMDLDEIVEQSLEKKVLVICNTVSKAQQIYKELEERTEEVYLLHSRYIRRDRNQLENMIMQFSENRETVGIWVTTQLVEASLDIDFDILYTEMCTADSLLQRMGRCNRKARYQPEEANIIVYANGNGVGSHDKFVYGKDLYDRSLNKLYEYAGKILSEKEKIDYINQVYCTEEIMETSYYKKIKEELDYFEKLTPLEYSKQEVDKEFRDIQSITVVPDDIYNENQKIFEKSIDVFEHPNISRNIKSVFTVKMNELTLNLNRRRNMEGVDAATVGEKKNRKILDIHRTRLKYEFDRVSARGRGLLLKQVEDEQFFI